MKVFSNSLEDTVPEYPKYLSWTIPHLINTQPLIGYEPPNPEAGAFYNVVNNFSHTGNKSLYLELSDVTKNRRNQLNIYADGLNITDELYVSAWIYLPADYRMADSYSPWHEIFDPQYPVLPYPDDAVSVRLGIEDYRVLPSWMNPGDPRAGKLMWGTAAVTQIGNTAIWNYENLNVPIPLGVWFNIRYWVKLSMNPDIGAYRAWINNNLLFDVKGITGYPYPQVNFATIPAKLYNSPNDPTPHQMWIDDIEIYDSIPILDNTALKMFGVAGIAAAVIAGYYLLK